MTKAFEAEEANTYVRLFNYNGIVENAIRKYCINNLAEWTKVPGDTWGSSKMVISHVFATFSPDKKEFRIGKHFYEPLLAYLEKNTVDTSNITLKKLEESTGKDVVFNTKKGIVLKPRNEMQEEYLDWFLREDKPLVVLNIPTGGGKTVVAIMGFIKLGKRVIITILPRYVPIWNKAFRELLNLKAENILNVSDCDINDLYSKLDDKEYDKVKIVFFQLTRITTYVKRMREEPDSIPHLDDFYKKLNCGVRIIDEAHESIYSVYSSLLYGNIKKNAALSATLRGDDDFINKIYKGTFPDEAYLKPPVYEKYIHVVAYRHRLNNERYRINTKGFGGYSHVLLEKGILRNPKIFENYYQVCKRAFDEFYMNEYRDGQKACWFFATKNFCRKFEARLKRDYPGLDAYTFTGDESRQKDKADEYLKHRVLITTPGSCSTGKDIPKLFIVFACVAISSSQRNDQMQGRTRPIDAWWPDLDPIFLYFVCDDIPKHLEYHKKRRQVLAKKTKKFSVVESGLWV